MTLPDNVEPLFAPLRALQRLLSRFDERGAIIGAVATSLIGRPRYTEDVDAVFLLSLEDLPRFLEAAGQEGLHPRTEAAADFARKNRVLLMKHTDTDTRIDISLGILPFEEELVERSIVHEFGDLKVRLPTPEDLIIMKAIAHRPKDMQDILDLRNKYPQLDKKRIRRWLKDFGEALEQPGLWHEIKALLEAAY